jgi:hypothetical protein
MNSSKSATRNTLIAIMGLVLLSGILLPVNKARAYSIDETKWCDEIDPDTGEPLGIGFVYFTHNREAILWMKMRNVERGTNVRFDWFDPDDGFYTSNSYVVPSPPTGTVWTSYELYDSIQIEDAYPAQNTGTWKVDINVDDTLEESTNFLILDFANEVYGLITEFGGLRDELDNLKDDYNELASAYDSLQEEYNKTSSDNAKLKGALNTQRPMTYGAVGIAVVAIGVAVYFITKKR